MALTETTARRSNAKAGQPPALSRRLADLRVGIGGPVLLYFLSVMLPISFKLGPLTMTGTRLVLIVMFLPLMVQLSMGRFGRVLLTDVLFLIHVIWMVVSLAVNNPSQAISNAGSTGIEFIGGYALGRAYVRSAEDFSALIRLLAMIALCTFPFAIYETLTGHAIILDMLAKLPGISSLRDLSIGKRMGLDRVQLVFVHPIHYGLFCTIALSLCYIGLKDVYGNGRRLAISVVVGLSGLLALSSGALLAIVMQLILMVWAFMFRNTKKRWLILLGIFALFYITVDLLSNRAPLNVFLSYATFSPSTAYWRTIIFHWGMINVWANPLFGLGLNDWIRPSYMRSGSMDNFWLLTAVRYGIPGFLTLAVGYAVALWKIGRRNFDSDEILWQFRRAWMFSFVGLTFTICTVHIWHTIYSFVFFMFGAGMWM
ncbi:MAG: O-antigen ligase family protein, partial [Cypionkella sp.]